MASPPRIVHDLGISQKCRCTVFFIFVFAVLTYRRYILKTTVELRKTATEKLLVTTPSVLQSSQDEAPNRKGYDVMLSTPCLMRLAGNKSHKRYAVFSSNWDGDSFTYSFLLPLTTLAWRRIGYGSVVLIVGDLQKWRSTPARNLILESTFELTRGAIGELRDAEPGWSVVCCCICPLQR